MQARATLVTLMTGAALAAAPAAAGAQGLADERPSATPDGVIVRFEPGVSAQGRAATRRSLRVRALRGLPLAGLQLVAPSPGSSVDATVAALEREPGVRYAHPDHVVSTVAVPDDTRYAALWALRNTGQAVPGGSGTPGADTDAEPAWDRETSGAGVVTAVVDGGIALDHPDLAPNVWTNPGEIAGNGIDDDRNGFADDVNGWDFAEDDAEPQDVDGHGTHVAGTLAARGDNGAGTTGVAWSARLMSVRVIDGLGMGKLSDILEGFAYAAANGAKVVNASFGGKGVRAQAERDVIAAAPDTLFVTAAMNSAADNDAPEGEERAFPCSHDLPNLICVAASTNTDALATFTNWGATTVDLAAPGRSVLSTRPAYGEDELADDFETPLAGRWTTAGTNDAWGLTNSTSFSPTSSLADSPAGAYQPNTDATVTAVSSVSLEGERGCRAFYRIRAEILGADRLHVETSADGATWDTHVSHFGNSQGAFVAREANMTMRDGETAARLRFRMQSDAATEGDGAYLDDVAVRCLGTTYGPGDFRFLDGTSMAAPHVSGAAALLRTAAPGATAEAVRDALIRGVDPIASHAGRTVSGGRLNVDRALAALARVVVTESGTTDVAEGGAGDGYQVALALRPKSDVTVRVVPDGQVAASPSTLTFTRANWSTPQPVAVAAVDDTADEPDDHAGAIAHTVASADAAYAGLAARVVSVRVRDDESPRVEAAPNAPPPLIAARVQRTLPARFTGSARLRVRRGRFAIRLACPPQADGRCTGTLEGRTARRRLFRRAFSVRAAATSPISVAVPRRLRGRRRAALVLTLRQPGARPQRRPVTLVSGG